MKTILFYLACTVLLMNACKANSRYTENEVIKIKESQDSSLRSLNQDETLLNNIQQKIMTAFTNGKITQSDKDLNSLEQSLLTLNSNKKNSIITYWYSYICYYHSILSFTENDKEKSEETLEKGIKQLNDLSPKNAEHLALLALMESFSIQYALGIEVPFISKRIKQNAQKALQLDSLNLRAYFVLGSNDFYTPEQYGGGKKAEGYLLKTITLNDQTVANPYLPSWGKNSAYEMLIRLYLNRKQYPEAKKYYQEAIALYPNDYMINKLANELINH